MHQQPLDTFLVNLSQKRKDSGPEADPVPRPDPDPDAGHGVAPGSATTPEANGGAAPKAKTGAEKEPTLKDLLDNHDLGPSIREGIAFVAKTATLAEAKAAMQARARCQDVFFTEHGSEKEPVQAWITNNDLAKALQAD